MSPQGELCVLMPSKSSHECLKVQLQITYGHQYSKSEGHPGPHLLHVNKLAADKNRRRHVSLRGGETDTEPIENFTNAGITNIASPRHPHRRENNSAVTTRARAQSAKKEEGEPTAMTLFVTENNMNRKWQPHTVPTRTRQTA